MNVAPAPATATACRAVDAAGNQGGYSATARATTPSPTTTYSVGGNVSGLSGTVVLQDNGGDDLSVSANGAFTFATKLADGAAYSVTVKTQPVRADLHGLQRVGDSGRRQRHRRRGRLRRQRRARLG